MDSSHLQDTSDDPGSNNNADAKSQAADQQLQQDEAQMGDEVESQPSIVLSNSTRQTHQEAEVGSNRLTKSASWFNSLSRRASRKTPILKKRSFPGSRSVEKVEKVETKEKEEEEEMGLRESSRARLNK